MKSRSKKAMLNIVTSAIHEIVALIATMILPRYILAYFGSTYNGITSSAAQFLSLISVLTLGVTAATRVALYKTLAKDDVKGTSSIILATERYMRKIGLILLAYIVGLAALYPVFVNTGFAYFDVAVLILITGASSFAEYYFGITYRTFLLADQSVYISNIFTIIAVICNMILSIILIKSGCSIQVVKFGSAVVFVLKPILQNVYVTKKYRIDRNCTPNPVALEKRNDAMAHALANIVHDQTDIVVLTLLMDVKIVSVYTIYNMVMAALKKIQAIFTTGTEPIFGNMWVKKEYDGIKQNLGVFEFLISSYVSVVYSVAFAMLLPFVALYTRGITDVEYIRPVYAFIITAAFAVQGIRQPYLSLVQGIGHYKETKPAAFFEAGINLALSVIFVMLIGMPGVAVGTLAANCYRTFHYALYIDKNVVHRGKRVIFLNMLWCVMNVAVIVAPSYLVLRNIAIEGWKEWLICSAILGIISLAVVFSSAFLFYRKRLGLALGIVGRMINLKKFGFNRKQAKK